MPEPVSSYRSALALQILEGAADAFVAFDDQFRFVFANPAAERLLGMKEPELVGRSQWEAFPATAGSPLETGYRRAMDERVAMNLESFNEPLQKWYDVQATASEDGGLFVRFRDITERKRAEEAVRAERQRFSDVLDQLPAYLVLLSPDYHVPFANRFFRERFGESHGRRCFEYLFNRTEPCEICETYSVLKTSAPHRWEWTGPDGRNYDIYDFPFKDTDRSTLIMEVGLDITERQRAEAELAKHRDHLEDLVNERTSQLEAANAQLEAEIAERKQAEQRLAADLLEHARAQAALRESEKRNRFLAGLLERADQPFGIGYPDGRLGFVNSAFERLTGYSRDELQGMDWAATLTPPEWHETERTKLEELHRTGRPVRYEKEYLRKDGTRVPIELLVHLANDDQGRPLHYYSFLTDLTERKRAEREREITVELLRLANESKSTRALIQAVVTFFRKQSGCEAVGVRLREGDDYPYFEAGGFPPEFVLLENRLCARGPAGQVVRDSAGNPVLECMCGNVISGRFDPAKPFFTAHGSFWTNCTTELLASTTEADRQARTRDRCNGEGYESVALLPLRAGSERLGLLQLNDRRKGMFSAETIVLWERLASHLAIALAKLRADEAMRESEDRVRRQLAEIESIYESAPVGLCVFDRELRYVRINERLAEINGVSAADHLGKTPLEIIPDLAPLAEEVAERIFRTREPVVGIELSGATTAQPGVRRHWEEQWLPLKDKAGNVVGINVVVEEVTERKQAEERLRRLAQFPEQNPNPVLRIADRGALLYANAPAQTWLAAMGGAADQPLPDAVQALAASACGQQGPIETEIGDGRGRTFWFASTQPSGEHYVNLYGRDVTERKRAEQDLRESREDLNRAQAVAHTGSWRLDVRRNELLWSDETYRIFGIPKGTPLSYETFLGAVHPEERQYVDQKWMAALRGEPYDIEHRILVGDTVKWVRERAELEFDRQGTLLGGFGTVQDITERKRAEEAVRAGEERLRQAQKMESIGVLAGGIAHDFNNLLTSILGNASLLQMEAPAGNDVQLRAIIESSERAASLTRQLLAYAGKGQFQIADFDVARLVRSSADLLRVSIPKNIDIQLDVPRNLPAVRGDSSQIQQVVMNLVINAAEANEGRKDGRVSVSAGLRNFDSVSASRVGSGLAPGRYISITVRDNGCGMDEQTKAKIFDPFFTTKFTGRGLGLAAVHGILQSHKGTITVESSPGQGSTFTVYLPCSGPRAAALGRKDAGTAGRPAATVLVVDDEESVLSFTKTALERVGYRVMLAENGRQALDLLSSHGDVDLVLLDIIMPVVGGAEAFLEMRKKSPKLAVLVASGYSRQEALRLGIPDELPFIEKPYTVQTLAAAVEKTLRDRTRNKE